VHSFLRSDWIMIPLSKGQRNWRDSGSARALASIAALDFRTVSSCSTHSQVRGSYQILAIFLCSPSRFTRLIFSQSYFSLFNLYPSHRRTWAARRVVGSDAARARQEVGRMLVFSFFSSQKIAATDA